MRGGEPLDTATLALIMRNSESKELDMGPKSRMIITIVGNT